MFKHTCFFQTHLPQVYTCALLAERYGALGREAEAASHRAEMEEKGQELQETADATVSKVGLQGGVWM